MKIIILCKPKFSSAIKTSFLLKTQKSNSSASDWWENSKSSFKENARVFLKILAFFENSRIVWLKTYKINFINKKTSKEKVLNFVLTLGSS